jgi:hypothetical protein
MLQHSLDGTLVIWGKTLPSTRCSQWKPQEIVTVKSEEESKELADLRDLKAKLQSALCAVPGQSDEQLLEDVRNLVVYFNQHREGALNGE